VLLHRRPVDGTLDGTVIAASVAPDNPWLGIMLPYTPLHHLLMRTIDFPVVATSGNLSDEPICTDEHEALSRLNRIADLFLVHDRPIARHVDDSVVRIVADQPMVLRAARGYAPMVVSTGSDSSSCLAVGGQLKNSVAVAKEHRITLSQHIGDLETKAAYDAFRTTIHSLSGLSEFIPDFTVCDLHPDYLSSVFARRQNRKYITVQHHYAHVLSGMADNALSPPVLGVSWDGTGLGPDGTIWGGEFLLIRNGDYERVAHLRPFRLPGGDAAIREPRRTAVALLYEINRELSTELRQLPSCRAFSERDLSLLLRILSHPQSVPVTTSMGRLFDAVASLLGLCHCSTFEGEAAMQLEFAADAHEAEASYEFACVTDSSGVIIDWEPVLQATLCDITANVDCAIIAARFHKALATMIVRVAQHVGEKNIVLTGGCFQNKRLTELAIRSLRQAGFTPFWHHRVPPNDGGLAVGQAMAPAHMNSAKE
jgi:hydrogenase maturation protein HypF